MGSGRDSTHRGKMAQCSLGASSSPTPPIAENMSASCLASVLPLRSCPLVDVHLDPDTAYSRLVVSNDRKSVRYGLTQQNLPDNPERFYRYNIVLGSQCISSKWHYWEVEVGNRSEWGVYLENVDRKEVVYLSPQCGFWVIKLRKGTEYRAGTDEHPPLPLSVPPHWVGIFLDCEAHGISFYNVTDGGSHISLSPAIPSQAVSCPISVLATALALTTPCHPPFVPWMERARRAILT